LTLSVEVSLLIHPTGEEPTSTTTST